MMQQPGVRTIRTEGTSVQSDRVAVAAVGIVTADMDELARLQSLDRHLRHADEQTILALAAVRRACETTSLGPFDDWGVIVSPLWQGRSGTTAFIERYHEIGVRGIGPHAIPNLILHAAAATISICLGSRGPVYGVGGGPAHVADGLFAGLTAQLSRDDGGTWLVLTEWDGGFGRAVALGLVADGTVDEALSLGLRSGNSPLSRLCGRGVGGEGGFSVLETANSPLTPGPSPAKPGEGRGSDLAGLMDFLSNPDGRRWDCPLDGGGELSISSEDAP